jgi:hypothetical protein
MPGYYDVDFPKDLLEKLKWKGARELARIAKEYGPQYLPKMRVMEWAVKALYNLDDEQMQVKAKEIFMAEKDKPEAEQSFGNLLAVLMSKVGTGPKDHEQIEHVFKFVIGIEPAAENPLSNGFLHLVVSYAKAHGIELKPAVLAYDAQPKVAVETKAMTKEDEIDALVASFTTSAPTFTPGADKAASTAPSLVGLTPQLDPIKQDVKPTAAATLTNVMNG